MEIYPIQQYQNHNHNQKFNPSFKALKKIIYNRSSLDDALFLNTFIKKPGIKRFCEKYDVIVRYYTCLDGSKTMDFDCRDVLKGSERNSMLQKIINFFKPDNRKLYEFYYNSKNEDLYELTESKLEDSIFWAKQALLYKEESAKFLEETRKSIDKVIKK